MGSIRDGVDARISPDGRTLAVSCNGDGRLELWDFPLRKPWGWIAAVIVAAAWSLLLVGIPMLILLSRTSTRHAYGIP